MTLVVKKMKRTKQRMEWWKLERGRMVFKEELRHAVGGGEVLPDVWRTTANVIRETSRRALGVPSEKKVAKERP